MNDMTATLADACARLRAGDLVAFPTETVYGLGGDTMNPDAIGRIYALKGRPQNNPLIAHVTDVTMAQTLCSAWTDAAQQLASRFWPGPLTMILPRHSTVPAEAAAGLDTIAVRCPSHPMAQALLAAFHGPISAPSANRSGHVSPTSAAHVRAEFPVAPDLMILDGGSCTVGLESTVLDCSQADEPPRVLRPGHVTISAIRGVLPDVQSPAIAAQDIGPGTSASHYAPSIPTSLVDRSAIEASSDSAALICLPGSAADHLHRVELPADAARYARGLYDALRIAESMPVDDILIERPSPDLIELDALWLAILDRLQRASAPR